MNDLGNVSLKAGLNEGCLPYFFMPELSVSSDDRHAVTVGPKLMLI